MSYAMRLLTLLGLICAVNLLEASRPPKLKQRLGKEEAKIEKVFLNETVVSKRELLSR